MNAQPQTKTRLTRKKNTGNHKEDVMNMTKTFQQNVNPIAKNPIELAMDKFHRKQKTDPVDFFLAWSVNPSVIAERLRRLGYEITLHEVTTIMHNGIQNTSQRSMLTIAMMETLNDLNKTLYKTNVL